MMLRRSMLFLPGSNAAMLSTAFVYKPDSIMFDLEDAVSLREKDAARLLVFHTLRMPIYRDSGIETVVRINPLSTPFGLKDLEAVVRAGVDVVPPAEDRHRRRRAQARGRGRPASRPLAAARSARPS